MKNEIQTWMKNMGDASCLALCYIFSTLKGREMNEFEANAFMVAGLLTATENNIVSEDGFVNDGKKLCEMADPENKYSIEKRAINAISELKIGETAAVAFAHNGKKHWVLVDNGQVVFDSLNDSVCRKYGKVVDARVITKEAK